MSQADRLAELDRQSYVEQARADEIEARLAALEAGTQPGAGRGRATTNDNIEESRVRITEDWLKSVGFKWHQLDRQPERQWLLWLLTEGASIEELGIELAPVGHDEEWFCWLRADLAGRYSRFLHVRHLRYQEEVIRLVAALTGRAWRPEDHFYGLALPPARAAREREDQERLDRRFPRRETGSESSLRRRNPLGAPAV